MKKKQPLAKLFENNQFMKIFAVVTAVLLYVIVAMTYKGTTDYVVYGVPVDLDLQSANLSNLRLNVVGQSEFTVDVKINGERTEVPKYGSDSPFLVTTANVANVSQPGKHALAVVSAYQNREELPFEIVGYSPNIITVTFDRMLTKTFEVTPVVKGVSTAPGYVWDDAALASTKVTVSGPESEVSKIASAQAVLELNEELTSSRSRDVPIVLLDAQGEAVSKENLSLDSETVQVVVTVLKETGLPLEVDFINTPQNFIVDRLKESMKMSVEHVKIAGPASIIDSLTEIHLGPVDLKTLSPDNCSFNYPLGLDQISEQLQSMEGITSVSVFFDNYNWQTKSFNVKEIEARNIPSDYEVELVTQTISNVEFVGVDGTLDDMTSDDIVAVVDLSDSALDPGQKTYPVKISAPSRGLAWALGDHSVVLQVTKKEAE